MKQIFILTLLIAPVAAYSAAPSTSCPSGYVTIEEDYMTIANSSCPSGYTSAGTADSCLVSSPSGSCMMYAPANTTYDDTTGDYQFTEACPLE